MNICLITTLYPPEMGGGIGTYIYNLSMALSKLGHNVHVIAKSNNVKYKLEVIDGVSLHRVQEKTIPFLDKFLPGVAWSFQVYRLIKQIHLKSKIDIIEFPNWEAPGIISQYLLKNIPSVVRVHTPYFETLELDKNAESITFEDRLICFLEKSSCNSAKQLVSSTLFHANMIAKEYNFQLSRFKILPLGVMDKCKVRSKAKTQEQDTDIFKILYVSRLENRKGTLSLIDALPIILKDFPKIQVDFVGSDRPHAPGHLSFKTYFDQKYSKYSESVKFHGYVSDEELDTFYREAHLFVVPSVYESFGLIYIEAMMYALPSIATMGGGIPEVVEHNKNGILLNKNNTLELAEKISMLYVDNDLRNKLACHARDSFEKKFDYMIMANNTLQMYENAICG